MSASAKQNDTPRTEVIREPQTKEEWEQAYIVVLQRAHDAERKLAEAVAALRKYGRHSDECENERPTCCICGFDEATK